MTTILSEPRSGLTSALELEVFDTEQHPGCIVGARHGLGHIAAAMGDDTYVDIRAVALTIPINGVSAPRGPAILFTVNKAEVLFSPQGATDEAEGMMNWIEQGDPCFKRALVIRAALVSAVARAGRGV